MYKGNVGISAILYHANFAEKYEYFVIITRVNITVYAKKKYTYKKSLIN